MKSAVQMLLGGMLAAVTAVSHSAKAQIQTIGTPSSPGATTTISGKQLPAPEVELLLSLGGCQVEKKCNPKVL